VSCLFKVIFCFNIILYSVVQASDDIRIGQVVVATQNFSG